MYYLRISLFLLLGSLCSCSSQSQPVQKSSPSQMWQSSPFVVGLPEKAEKVCGDRPPEDPTSYPVNFYPVSVEYSVDNLAKIKKHFCEDALKRYSSQAKKDIIQVGSFTGKEKAESFRAKLSQHFGQVTIGEPTIIEKPKTAVSDQKSNDEALDTVEKIAKVALLNSEQLKKLLDLEKSNLLSLKDMDKKFEIEGMDNKNKNDKKFEMGKVKVLVPTYVPPGFKLVKFYTIPSIPTLKERSNLKYDLQYKSSTGQSFRIYNSELLGDGIYEYKSGELYHPLFGNIKLWYKNSDKLSGNDQLDFPKPYYLCYKGKMTGYGFYSGNKMDFGKIISREEAIKIVNSLTALNPNTKFDRIPQPQESQCDKQ